MMDRGSIIAAQIDTSDEFLADLRALLRKHGAELEISDDGNMTVDIQSIWDDRNMVRPFTSVNLGCYINGDET